MRCKSCNSVMSDKDNTFVEEILEDGTKIFTELCMDCRYESCMEHSVLMKDYHFDHPTLETDITTLSYRE